MVHFLANSAMDINKYPVNNFDNTRRINPLSSNVSSRSFSIVSKTSTILYYERMVINNNTPDKESREPIDSSQLSYEDNS